MALLFAAWNVSGRIAISNSTSHRIVEGMTKQEVLNIAERPHYTNTVDDNCWDYRVWNGIVFYSDPMHVCFDENECVDVIAF